MVEEIMSEFKWKTAIYLRYSDKEDGKSESGSIETQRSMLRHYIDQHEDLEYTAEYADDNYTGTNFNRPGFQELKRRCLDGEIQCILVKDHSRFARKSAKMQIMLEDELENTRYISKDDHFDSRTDDYDLIFQVKTLLNEAYAQDISRKVHSSIDSKQREGKFIGAFAPFGYEKDPKDKNKLIIDEDAAEVVRQIYQLRMDGVNVANIARVLNNEGILTPYAYKISKGYNYVSPTATLSGADNKYLWDFTTVNRILRCQTYAGDLVQGRKRQKMRNKPKVKPREEWVVAANSVPAIVARETYAAVQDLLDNAKCIPPDTKGVPHMFSGLVHCGECGRACVKARKSKSETLYYACGTRKRNGRKFCDTEYIRADVLEQIVLSDINAMIGSVHNLETLLLDNIKKDGNKEQNNKAKKEQEKQALNAQLLRRYEHFDRGLLSEENYLIYKQNIENQIKKIDEELKKWDQKRQERSVEINEWCCKLLKMGRLDKLDRETIQETVGSIKIFKGKKIEIVYKFDDFKETLQQYANSRAD